MEVRAAGGGVWRRSGDGDVVILVVHRPRYDDWSLPKGKADPGESDAECALREVEEETGFACLLGDSLPSTRYVDNKGRDKIVRYFAMEPVSGDFVPNSEVDEILWLAVPEALRVLSYAHDRPVLESFEPPPRG